MRAGLVQSVSHLAPNFAWMDAKKVTANATDALQDVMEHNVSSVPNVKAIIVTLMTLVK